MKRFVNVVEVLALLCAAAFVVGLFITPAKKVPPPTDNAVGAAVYAQRCAGCHGPNGEGSFGPKLNGGRVVERFPDPADEILVVETGPGGMPAFKGTLTDEEIEAVVRFTREDLAERG